MKKLKIAFVGMGKRLQNQYMPIFNAFPEDFEIVGLTTKNIDSGKEKAKKFNIKHYVTLEDLNSSDPDVFLICVPAEASCTVAKEVMKFGKPIMMETPVYDGSIVQECNRLNIKFGIVEQWPFLPLEQFKRKIIESGVLGDIFMVENDNRSYDYHGISQLRSYLGDGAIPYRVVGSHFGCIPPSFENETGRKGSGYEGWDHGVVTFSNGKSLIHKFCYNFKMAPFRFMQSLRIHGTKGMMVNWCTERRCNDYEMIKIAFYDEKDKTHQKPSIIVSRQDETTKDIEASWRTSAGGVVIIWKNPYAHLGFNDQETAVATYMHKMKKAIQEDLPAPYTLDSAFIDTLLTHLIKQSAQNESKPIMLGQRS